MQSETAKFDSMRSRIVGYLEPLKGLVVRDKAENAAASGALVTVRGLAKEIESVRVAAVGPINEQVKAINARAKELAAPLEAAETQIKGLMRAFVDAEAARIQAERRAAEAKAAEERRILDDRRQAEERAAAEKARAEREKQQAEERERRAAAEQAKRAEAAFGVADAEAEEKRAEEAGIAKQKADEASQRLEREHQESLARIRREVVEADAKSRAEERRLEAQKVSGTRTVWKFEIQDWQEVPQEFWMIDEAKVGAAVRGGAREIPGVRIYSEQAIVAGRS